MSGGLWAAIVGSGGLFAAVLLYFSLHGAVETKTEQHIQVLQQQQKQDEFDKNFAKAWNDVDAKIETGNVADVTAELANEKAKLANLQKMETDMIASGDQFLRDQDSKNSKQAHEKQAAAASAVVEATGERMK